tara:strand:+ start:1300 stop:1977 length:678 start_codon:yes stop_codon:yes gene_type:complete
MRGFDPATFYGGSGAFFPWSTRQDHTITGAGVEMKIRHDADTLVLTEPSWVSAALVSLGGIVMITLAALDLASDVEHARLVLFLLGVGVLLVGLLGSNHLEVVFDRPADRVTLTTQPIIPVEWGFMRKRSLVRNLSKFRYAYVELAYRSNAAGENGAKHYKLALASGDLHEDVLQAKRRPLQVATDESVRWIISTHASLSAQHALMLASEINGWMGVTPPPQHIP